MIRCALIELVLPGGGFALRGELGWAAADIAAMTAALALCLLTPWAVMALAAVRLAAVLEAGRRGRRGPGAGGWRWQPMLLVGAIGLGATMMARGVALQAFAIPTVSMAPTLQVDDKILVDTLSLAWRAPHRGEVVAFTADGRTLVKRVVALGGDTVAVREGHLFVNGEEAPRRRLGPTHYLEREPSGELRREPAMAFEERWGGHVYVVLETPDELDHHLRDYPRHGLGAMSCDRARPTDDTRPLVPAADETCAVPRGTLFLLGDNRGNSNDSRWLGAVPADQVFGRVVGVWLGGAGHHWSRIGAVE